MKPLLKEIIIEGFIFVIAIIICILLFLKANAGGSVLAAFLLFIGIFAMMLFFANLSEFHSKKKLRKMIQTADFVFAKEEIKYCAKNHINYTRILFCDDSVLLKPGHEAVLIRRTPDDETITYGFISANFADELEEKNTPVSIGE